MTEKYFLKKKTAVLIANYLAEILARCTTNLCGLVFLEILFRNYQF